MKQITFRCVCCRRIRPINPRGKDQEYCGTKSCQQARKNKWQREKLQTDPDYKADKREMQRSWRERNPDYWRQYRSKNPGYCERNRQRQRERYKKRYSVPAISTEDGGHLVKTDTFEQYLNQTTTSYYICPVGGDLVKKDALTVKIIPISPG